MLAISDEQVLCKLPKLKVVEEIQTVLLLKPDFQMITTFENSVISCESPVFQLPRFTTCCNAIALEHMQRLTSVQSVPLN